MTTEKQLFEADPASLELRKRVAIRAQLDAQDTCKRLVGMGGCAEDCPGGCEVFTQVGLWLVEREIDTALQKPEFGEEGQILLNIIDDDFRRLWNKQRGLIQEPTQHKLIRLGKVTEYGARFLREMKKDETLQRFGGDESEKLKTVDSWLRNLWDDACDNALMHVGWHSSGERTYRHRQKDLDDATARRYGFRADRLYRRRINGKTERKCDELLSEDIRPNRTESQTHAEIGVELRKVTKICEALFRAVEEADAEDERYIALDVSERSTPVHLSIRSKPGVLEVSLDDADRFDDGEINASIHEYKPLNPKTLFDDFVMAWGITRREQRVAVQLREPSLLVDPRDELSEQSEEHTAELESEE